MISELKKQIYEQGGNMLQEIPDAIEIDREKLDKIIDQMIAEFLTKKFDHHELMLLIEKWMETKK